MTSSVVTHNEGVVEEAMVTVSPDVVLLQSGLRQLWEGEHDDGSNLCSLCNIFGCFVYLH